MFPPNFFRQNGYPQQQYPPHHYWQQMTQSQQQVQQAPVQQAAPQPQPRPEQQQSQEVQQQAPVQQEQQAPQGQPQQAATQQAHYTQQQPQFGNQYNQMPGQQQQFGPPPVFHGGYGGYSHPYQAQRPSFLAAFKNKDGHFDFEKASTTIDQVVKVGNQITPIVKQVGSFFTSKS